MSSLKNNQKISNRQGAYFPDLVLTKSGRFHQHDRDGSSVAQAVGAVAAIAVVKKDRSCDHGGI